MFALSSWVKGERAYEKWWYCEMKSLRKRCLNQKVLGSAALDNWCTSFDIGYSTEEYLVWWVLITDFSYK